MSFIIEQSSVYLRNKAFSLFFSVLECFVEIQYRDQSTLYCRCMYQMHFPKRPSENLWEMFALVTQSNCFINFEWPLSWSHCFPLISHIDNILEFLCCCFDLWSASRLLHLWPFLCIARTSSLINNSLFSSNKLCIVLNDKSWWFSSVSSVVWFSSGDSKDSYKRLTFLYRLVTNLLMPN